MASIFESAINNLYIPDYVKSAVKSIRKICMEAENETSLGQALENYKNSYLKYSKGNMSKLDFDKSWNALNAILKTDPKAMSDWNNAVKEMKNGKKFEDELNALIYSARARKSGNPGDGQKNSDNGKKVEV